MSDGAGEVRYEGYMGYAFGYSLLLPHWPAWMVIISLFRTLIWALNMLDAMKFS